MLNYEQKHICDIKLPVLRAHSHGNVILTRYFSFTANMSASHKPAKVLTHTLQILYSPYISFPTSHRSTPIYNAALWWANMFMFSASCQLVFLAEVVHFIQTLYAHWEVWAYMYSCVSQVDTEVGYLFDETGVVEFT
jgi:hypothetical protein